MDGEKATLKNSWNLSDDHVSNCLASLRREWISPSDGVDIQGEECLCPWSEEEDEDEEEEEQEGWNCVGLVFP